MHNSKTTRVLRQICMHIACGYGSLLWRFETECSNALCMHDTIAPLMPLYRVKFWWRSVQYFWRENILIEITLRVHVVVRHISSNISACTGPIFAILSPYKSAIHADDGSLPYFPICQGTLPWQPNSFVAMKANWYYVHSLPFARLQLGFASLYLIGGDIVAPSGLLASLCQAFLVFF